MLNVPKGTKDKIFSRGQDMAQSRMKELMNKAEAGDADAQQTLGACYVNGQGVPQDYVKAFQWFTKSARRGNAKAQYNLGMLYLSGIGVVKSTTSAKLWLERSAAQGNEDAEAILRKYF